MVVAKIMIGASLLLLGRKLFWLVVSAIGFIAGLTFLPELFPAFSNMEIIIISIAAGILSAFIAVSVQKIAVGAIGFFIGGYLLSVLISALNIAVNQPYYWLIILIGGCLGACLASRLLKWALMLFSIIFGSILIIQTLPFSLTIKLIVFILLLIIGLYVQHLIHNLKLFKIKEA